LALSQAGARSEEIAIARAQVLSAKGSLQTIQALINDTKIRAPFSGTVTRKYADPGAFVTPTITIDNTAIEDTAMPCLKSMRN
jgi:HlyD family secretion protein